MSHLNKPLPIAFLSALTFLLVASKLFAQLSGFASYPNSNVLLPEQVATLRAEYEKPDYKPPETDYLLDNEYEHVDNYLNSANLTLLSSDLNPIKPEIPDNIKTALQSFRSTILPLSCPRPNDLKQFNKALTDLQRTLQSNIQQVYSQLDPSVIDLSEIQSLYPQVFPEGPRGAIDFANSCVSSQTAYKDADFDGTLTKDTDDLRKTIEKRNDELAQRKKQLQVLVNDLNNRKTTLQNAIIARSRPSAAQQITSYIWLIMLIIGASGVLTMLVVWLFDETIQMEWVASGQVIQFVTVMILFSVIMALGLSDILKEQTLGTLLGGIAGYILAQGVGRAALHQASKATNPAALPGNP
jgi:hypothetical protein